MVQPSSRRPINTIRWWWVILAAALTALATWIATWWLLSVAGTSADLRVQAIKAGLTVAAGTGGAVALLLATRRQWLQERDQSHREETDAANQAHQQRLTTLTELDATERRITDLYTKAVDQLGSEKAPVRLGGLYALERLAQDTPNQRQTIVNVICAYLRMPYTLPDPDEVGSDVARQELQVRFTAQRILAAHLNKRVDNQTEPDEVLEETADGKALPNKTRRFWNDIRIDLTGATLVNFDFSECTIADMGCSSSVFMGRADFRNTTFTGYANFVESTFNHSADFRSATFTGDANFSIATFEPQGVSLPAARFRDTVFDGEADFSGAKFAGDAVFYDARYNQGADFAQAQFIEAHFDKSHFGSIAFFTRAEFTSVASFINVSFSGPASFDGATFTQNSLGTAVDFHGAVFDTEPDFYAVSINNAQATWPGIDRQFWPEGWLVETGENGIGRLAHKGGE